MRVIRDISAAFTAARPRQHGSSGVQVQFTDVCETIARQLDLSFVKHPRFHMQVYNDEGRRPRMKNLMTRLTKRLT